MRFNAANSSAYQASHYSTTYVWNQRIRSLPINAKHFHSTTCRPYISQPISITHTPSPQIQSITNQDKRIPTILYFPIKSYVPHLEDTALCQSQPIPNHYENASVACPARSDRSTPTHRLMLHHLAILACRSAA